MTSSLSSLHKHTLGNLHFSSASCEDMVTLINERLALRQNAATDKTGFSIGYINPHVFNQSQSSADVAEFIRQCDLICLDGIGACLAVKARHGFIASPPVHRVVALHLFDALIKGIAHPCSAVLIGVDETDVENSALSINQQSENLDIHATIDGFRSDQDYAAFLEEQTDTDWILIGAGSPKSEAIALQARQLCPQAMVFHIGAGTIKVYAGSKRRAPKWASDHGLEWAHRIVFEPHTRERYTRGGWQFVSSLLKPTHRKDTRTPS